MYYDYYRGVYFCEGRPIDAKTIKPISTRLDGWFFSQSQLKSLDDVKSVMVGEVRKTGGNAVVDFKYCQKSSFWRSLFSVDDVRWEAAGMIARIDPSRLA